ncbi:MAG: hypothetical protein H0T54_07920 [Geodermatophilaceae bacterium]|nr:hypothetical protein [Geodermatophilaceae bacterium]
MLALVVQASGFGTAFKVVDRADSTILVLGTLTGVRVNNASVDDTALVIGMNRLRAAYLEMDPTLSQYLVTSWNDDTAGVMKTYTMAVSTGKWSATWSGARRCSMNVTNTIVAGTLGALIADASGGGAVAVSISGAIAGVAYLAAMIEIGRRSFGRPRTDARFPTAAE